MQYDVKTPAEYIEALDDDWRLEKLESLRFLIKNKAPNFIEGRTQSISATAIEVKLLHGKTLYTLND